MDSSIEWLFTLAPRNKPTKTDGDQVKPSVFKHIYTGFYYPENMMEDRWLSIEEIGEYLGVKRDAIYKWIKEKSMPCHRIGRSWRFKKDEVDAWVKSGKAGDMVGANA